MPEDFDQNVNRERHAAWESAHEVGSPTHRLRTSLVLKTVASLRRERRDETTLAMNRMSAGRVNATEFVYAGPGACLDAGCGTGEFAIALAGRGWQVTAFDPSEYAIDLARDRAGRSGRDIEFSVADLDGFVSERTFDLVLSVDVLEHIEDDGAAMLKLASLVSVSGALIVTVPMDPALWSSADEFSGHCRRYTRDSLGKLATASGLLVRHMACYGYPFTRLMWRAKRRMPAAEQRVVAAGGGTSPVKQLAARCVSTAAVGVTSIDKLFPNAKTGVGLLAVCRKTRD